MASSSAGRLLLCLAAVAALLHTPAPRRARHRVPAARAAARMPPPEEPGAPEEESGLDYAASVALGAAKRREREAALGASDMEVTFLGTASCVPSITRGVSCTSLRHDGTTWLFDAGEGSQIQVQRSHLVHPGKVDAIFVTHLHGDHSFGLPGLMCLIGQNRVKGDAPVEVFGPQGLRLYLRASLKLTHARVAAPYVVHELVGVPLLAPPGFRPPPPPFKQSETQLERNFLADPDKNFGEQRGGRDIRPDADGAWTLAPRGALAVRAAPMRHTVPCVGYVAVEPDKAGTLDVAKVEPILARNAEALKQAGVKEPKRIFRLLKDMARDQTFTFPDGTALKRSECVGEDKPGRVVVVCGDTADASALLPLLPPRGADVVVHEATNARLEPWDADKTDAEVAEATAAHGHSTPTMAAKFASLAAAKCLALTHFSPRYRGDSALSSISTMDKIEASARQGFDEDVIAAWDLLTLPVNAKTVEEAARREGDAERLAVADAVRKERAKATAAKSKVPVRKPRAPPAAKAPPARRTATAR